MHALIEENELQRHFQSHRTNYFIFLYAAGKVCADQILIFFPRQKPHKEHTNFSGEKSERNEGTPKTTKKSRSHFLATKLSIFP